MTIDLHNHTPLCNHATGSIEEFTQNAIEKKIDIFGFSDHAPMKFDEKYRMSFEQMAQYEAEVQSIGEKYKSEIDILLGYEVDYIKDFVDNRVINANVDYLIGSVHFLNNWGFDNPDFIGNYQNQDIDKIWEDYFEAIKEMAKSNLFDIVGHIDLIKIFKYLPKKEIKSIAKNAIKAIKKSNMVVEINAAGLRKPINEIYPSSDIMELLVDFDIPITFGSDAHKVGDISYKKDEIIKYAKSFGYRKCAIFRKKERELVTF